MPVAATHPEDLPAPGNCGIRWPKELLVAGVRDDLVGKARRVCWINEIHEELRRIVELCAFNGHRPHLSLWREKTHAVEFVGSFKMQARLFTLYCDDNE